MLAGCIHCKGLKQATPGPFTESKAGTDCWHRGSARGHRDAKWQPHDKSVAAGTWPGIDLIDGGRVSFSIELTTPACPVKAEFERAALERVQGLDGVSAVAVEMTSNTRKTVTQVADAAVLHGVK